MNPVPTPLSADHEGVLWTRYICALRAFHVKPTTETRDLVESIYASWVLVYCPHEAQQLQAALRRNLDRVELR